MERLGYYDYKYNVRQDVEMYYRDNYEDFKGLEGYELIEALTDACENSDYVTGKPSRSYFYGRSRAQECVLANMELLHEMAREWLDDATVADLFLHENWERFDVLLRCYVVEQVVAEFVEHLDDVELIDLTAIDVE